MKVLRKITSLVILGSLIVSMVACKGQEETSQYGKLTIGGLSGPTGMGMVMLMEDEEAYQVNIYKSPDEVIGKIITGELPIVAVPSNIAGVLYNKLDGDISILATNTLGILYIVENGDSINSISDLKGKSIIASGKGGSPEFILNKILKEEGIDPIKDITITWNSNHSDVASALLSKENTIAMLPQPFVSKVTGKSSNINVQIDLNNRWNQLTGDILPMGVVVGRRSFVEDNPKAIENFLKDYSDSVEFVNNNVKTAGELIAKHEIISDIEIAKSSIPLSNIVYISAMDSKDDLENFFKIIYEMDPKSVGGKLPNEDIFYTKKD